MYMKWTFISISVMMQVSYMVRKYSNENRVSGFKVLTNSLTNNKKEKSVLLGALHKKLLKNSNEEGPVIHEEVHYDPFVEDFMREKDSSKYFSFTSEEFGLHLMQILNRQKIVLYRINKELGKIEQCWSDLINGELLGAVSSNNKLHLAIFYKNKQSENKNDTYRIRYYHSMSCHQKIITNPMQTSQDLYDDQAYDDFAIHSSASISSMAISHNVIILAFAYDTQVQYSILTREMMINDINGIQLKWTVKYQKKQTGLSSAYYTQSLKFVNKDSVNLSFIHVYLHLDKEDNKVIQHCHMNTIKLSEANPELSDKRLITSELSNEELGNPSSFKQTYLRQKVISNGNINGELLFEILPGKIAHLSLKNQQSQPNVYLLYESMNKTEMITSDESGEYIAIKYLNDPNIYFVHKAESTQKFDSYSQQTSIRFPSLNSKPLTFSIYENKVFVLMDDGHFQILDMKRSSLNLEINITLIKSILVALLLLVWSYAIFQEKIKKVYDSLINNRISRSNTNSMRERTVC